MSCACCEKKWIGELRACARMCDHRPQSLVGNRGHRPQTSHMHAAGRPESESTLPISHHEPWRTPPSTSDYIADRAGGGDERR